MSLREQLAEERQVLLSREAEKAILETRIVRLTQIVLNSTRAILASQPSPSHGPHSPPHETSTSDILTRATGSTTHAPPSLGSFKEFSEAGNLNEHDKALASVRRERSTSSMVCCQHISCITCRLGVRLCHRTTYCTVPMHKTSYQSHSHIYDLLQLFVLLHCTPYLSGVLLSLPES